MGWFVRLLFFTFFFVFLGVFFYFLTDFDVIEWEKRSEWLLGVGVGISSSLSDEIKNIGFSYSQIHFYCVRMYVSFDTSHK